MLPQALGERSDCVAVSRGDSVRGETRAVGWQERREAGERSRRWGKDGLDWPLGS